MSDKPTLEEQLAAVQACVDAAAPILQRFVEDIHQAIAEINRAMSVILEAIRPTLTVVGQWHAEIEREAAKYNLSAEDYFTCVSRARANYDVAHYEWGMSEMVAPEPDFEEYLEHELKGQN